MSHIADLHFEMEGVVNYYIDEPEENYTILRGETDVYKFQLRPTEVNLHEATTCDDGLKFKDKGLAFATFPSRLATAGQVKHRVITINILLHKKKERER